MDSLVGRKAQFTTLAANVGGGECEDWVREERNSGTGMVRERRNTVESDMLRWKRTGRSTAGFVQLACLLKP